MQATFARARKRWSVGVVALGELDVEQAGQKVLLAAAAMTAVLQ